MLSHLDIARRYVGELWSLGRLDTVGDLVTADCAYHDPYFGDCVGAESLATRIRDTRRAFPGLTWRIDYVLADAGAQLAFTWSAFMRSTKVTGILLLRFTDDKLAAISSRWDSATPLRASASRPTAIESELDAQWDLTTAD